MAILLLNEDEVRGLLTMEMALEAVEQGFRLMAQKEAHNIPRSRCQTGHATLHLMSAAAAQGLGVMGYKAYGTSRQGAHFHVGLFDGETGVLSAILQADHLGRMRTGAASGVATRYLARPDARTVGLFGTGKQARTQLLAMCKVRKIEHVRVYSRTEETRRRFCQEMTELCQCTVEPAAQPEEAARDKDIVITATDSRTPVLKGEWLAEGTHLNIVGSNYLVKTEIDAATIRRARPIIVDSMEQARIEAGDFREALNDGSMSWADVHELGDVVVGRHPGRPNAQAITLFKSLGLAVEDVATAALVVAKGKEANVGRWVEW